MITIYVAKFGDINFYMYEDLSIKAFENKVLLADIENENQYNYDEFLLKCHRWYMEYYF